MVGEGDQLAESEAYPEGEDALVARAIGGDAGAFTQLYDRYHDRVYRHLIYRVGRSEDAEDLTQQVFLQAWRALARYRQTGSPFVAWLLTIAHNLVVSFYRRNRAVQPLDADTRDWPADDHLEAVAEQHLEHERARRLMLGLKAEYQQVLAMRFLENLEYREIAAALGKSEGNVRVMQHRALQQLRRLVQADEKR